MPIPKIFKITLFAFGFRAFFLLAGMAALFLLVLWTRLYGGDLSINNYYPAFAWHAHEMLLGYSVAVIAGFLLTAVRNWTGKPTPSGGKLAILCLLWILGRLLPFFSGVLSDSLIALVDMAFLPVLAWQISLPIMRAKNYKSLIFVGLLLMMTLGNGLIHAEILGFQESMEKLGVKIIVMAIILMILVIAGRVFPFFTERGLPDATPQRKPVIDLLSIGSAMLVFILDIFEVTGWVLALAALVAVTTSLLRISGWYVNRIWSVSLLWILYLGYGWIITGFFLMALSAYAMVLPSLALHAFTVGGVGVITLGMMARASLVYTGRVLKASRTMVVGFLLINLAASVRILMPIAFPAEYAHAVNLSAVLWLASFTIFLFVNVPILTRPRKDGRPG